MISSVLTWLAFTKIGRVVAVVTVAALVLGSWHLSAVRSSNEKLVVNAELAGARAALKETERRLAVSEQANDKLILRTEVADAHLQRTEKALERYARENPVNADCVVDDAFIDWLPDTAATP